jgi:hypothetical protein
MERIKMYFKKMIDMPTLQEDHKQDLIAEATRLFETEKDNRVLYHRRYELENANSLNYIKNEDMDFYEKSGGVSALSMSEYMRKRTFDFFKRSKHPTVDSFETYVYLFVEGGPFCAPHIDDVGKRRHGLQLLLKSGGDNVKTAWYEPKEQFKHLPVIDYCGIPYSKIDLKLETCIEENYWYWMKFDSIHSIENLQSLRIFIAAL